MERVTLQVTGMTCGGCETAVKRAVARLEGVSNVTASHTDNQVTVEYDRTLVDRAKITAAITRAGYTAS
jgi:copper chaperone